MPVKVTVSFTMATTKNPDSPQPRVSGWTESFWDSSDTVDGTAVKVEGGGGFGGGVSILARRAAFLPLAASITGYNCRNYRFAPDGELIPNRDSLPVAKSIAGAYNDCDIPQMALLCKLGHSAGHANVSSLIFRGIPDSQVSIGEADFDPTFREAVNRYLTHLGLFGNVIQDLRAPGVVRRKIKDIGDDGVVRLLGISPPPVAIGDYLKVFRTTNASGRQVGGVFRVTDVSVGDAAISLAGWSAGDCIGGACFKHLRDFAQFDGTNVSYDRIITRKVGRAPGQYRGINKRKLK